MAPIIQKQGTFPETETIRSQLVISTVCAFSFTILLIFACACCCKKPKKKPVKDSAEDIECKPKSEVDEKPDVKKPQAELSDSSVSNAEPKKVPTVTTKSAVKDPVPKPISVQKQLENRPIESRAPVGGDGGFNIINYRQLMAAAKQERGDHVGDIGRPRTQGKQQPTMEVLSFSNVEQATFADMLDKQIFKATLMVVPENVKTNDVTKEKDGLTPPYTPPILSPSPQYSRLTPPSQRGLSRMDLSIQKGQPAQAAVKPADQRGKLVPPTATPMLPPKPFRIKKTPLHPATTGQTAAPKKVAQSPTTQAPKTPKQLYPEPMAPKKAAQLTALQSLFVQDVQEPQNAYKSPGPQAERLQTNASAYPQASRQLSTPDNAAQSQYMQWPATPESTQSTRPPEPKNGETRSGPTGQQQGASKNGGKAKKVLDSVYFG